MTIKKAKKQIRKLTAEAVQANQEHKIEKITRKIDILRDFINFEFDLYDRRS